MGPAYKIVTERLCLRCYTPEDARALKDAIDASVGALRPWLAWAGNEPQSLDAKVDLLRHFRGRFDLGKDFAYGIFDHEQIEVLGGAGLHKKYSRDAREIGYWIAARHTGRGLATETAAALVRVAFEVDRVARVEIHCDSENTRSAAIARKLGFRHDATLRARNVRADGTRGPEMIWSLLLDEYPVSPSARAQCEAFDAIGRQLLALPRENTGRRGSGFR